MTAFCLVDKIDEFAKKYPGWYNRLTSGEYPDVRYVRSEDFRNFVAEPDDPFDVVLHSIVALRCIDPAKFPNLTQEQRFLLTGSMNILERYVAQLISTGAAQADPEFYKNFKNDLISYVKEDEQLWARVRVLYATQEAASISLANYNYPQL